MLRISFLEFQINVAHKVYIVFNNAWYEKYLETPTSRICDEKNACQGTFKCVLHCISLCIRWLYIGALYIASVSYYIQRWQMVVGIVRYDHGHVHNNTCSEYLLSTVILIENILHYKDKY